MRNDKNVGKHKNFNEQEGQKTNICLPITVRFRALAAAVPRILWRQLARVERRSLIVCLRCEPGGAVTFNAWIFFWKVDNTLLCALSLHWSNTKPTQVSRLDAVEPPRHSRLSSQDADALHLQTTELTLKTLISVQLTPVFRMPTKLLLCFSFLAKKPS